MRSRVNTGTPAVEMPFERCFYEGHNSEKNEETQQLYTIFHGNAIFTKTAKAAS